MAPVRTPPGWPHLALLLSVLLLSACRSSALSPPASEVQPRPATLKATFVTAWGGVPERSLFSHPTGVAGDDAGFVYVADTERNRVLKFNSAGPLVATWETAGDGSRLSRPAGVRADAAGNLYVTDTKNPRVQKLGPAGTFLKTWGSYGFTAGHFNAPSGIAVNRTGNVFVADTWNQRIQKFDAEGRFLLEWGALGRGDGRFNAPTGIAVDRAGRVHVISAGLQPAPSRNLADIFRVLRVQICTGAGTLLQAWGRAGSGAGQFDRAMALALDRAGNVYVADTENHRVQKFGPSGTPLRQWGALPVEVLKRPAALTADAAGHVYIAGQGNFRVVRADQRGTVLAVWLFSQTAVFEDVAVGPAGAVYVALTESGVPLVRKLSASGATEGELRGFASVKGVAVDGAGNLYVADWRSQEIRRFDPAGRAAGPRRVQFPGGRGGGGGAGPACFYQPRGTAGDGPGTVSVAEPLLNRVQVFRVKLSLD